VVSSCARNKFESFEQKKPQKVKRNHNAAWRYVCVVVFVQKALRVRAGECTDFVFLSIQVLVVSHTAIKQR
jgi:hypothetical protein